MNKHEWCEKDGCQFSQDVSMPEYSCKGRCQYLTTVNSVSFERLQVLWKNVSGRPLVAGSVAHDFAIAILRELGCDIDSPNS